MGHRKDYQSPDFKAKMIASFWAKVDRRGPDECWPWTAAITPKTGYGHAQVAGHQGNSHRMAYGFLNGPIPKGLNVLHRCDNPPCCNPDHLFLGPQKKNMEDMVAKGRSLYGEKHKMAKLDWPRVDMIRRLFKEGAATIKQLAARFGVDQSTIAKICRNKLWVRRHL